MVEAAPDEFVAKHFALQPPVALDGRHGDPRLGVVVQHSRYQVLEGETGFLAELTPELVGLFPKHSVKVDCRKGVLAHDHHKEDDSQTPNIGRLSKIASSTLDLGGHVEDRPALLREAFGLAGLGVGHFCGKAKVSDPDFQILTNEDVVEFQVAVADVLGMHVGNSGNDLLGEEVATDVFGESTDLGDDVKKFVLAVLKS